MKRFFRSIVSSVFLAGVLVACGSNVKLQDVPVEDRAANSAQADADAAARAAAAAAAARGVAPVQIGALDSSVAGPANATKIIYFDFDSFVVKPEFQSVIEAHAKFMAANKTRRMAIEGHTDESGGREYNLALGQKRAEAVRLALGLSGVTDSQVEAVSFGKEKPAAAGFDDASMAKNRRAEISYR